MILTKIFNEVFQNKNRRYDFVHYLYLFRNISLKQWNVLTTLVMIYHNHRSNVYCFFKLNIFDDLEKLLPIACGTSAGTSVACSK